ncbi:MAG: hypothetical protein LBR29_03295 [Methylobacteriaceae bacterium]|jgi:hypothetical protein|nr:hypothetical protein [Methylobacteriaceae bacterium]
MKQPERDQSGKVIPHDHPELFSDDMLIRRISPYHLTREGNGQRVSSKAFHPSSAAGEGMSVDIKKLIIQDGKTPRDIIATTGAFIGAVEFPVAVVRNEGLLAGWDPLEDNPYHGQVWGKKPPDQFTKGKQKKILAASKWTEGLSIPGVLLPFDSASS